LDTWKYRPSPSLVFPGVAALAIDSTVLLVSLPITRSYSNPHPMTHTLTHTLVADFMVLRRIGGKSGLTGREAGKLVVAKPTIHLSLLSPCILLILPLSGQAMTP